MAKSIMKSAWFWCLLAALVLILISLFISSGTKCVNGWAWTFFVLALILATVGIVFAILDWLQKPKLIQNIQHTHIETYPKGVRYSYVEQRNPYIVPHMTVASSVPSVTTSQPVLVSSPITTQIASPVVTSQTVMSPMSPMSPMVMPSGNINGPQSEKGFSSTNTSLSDLAFNI